MIIAICGPTGVGKTEFSLKVAKKFNCEIINYDSMQVYKGLDIGTAKITDTKGIKHHLLDFVEVEEDYSVFNYQKDAREKIEEIISSGKNVLFVGGTALYLKAALYDYKFPQYEKKNEFLNFSNEELYDKLLKIDPSTKIHKNNRKRVIASLNYFMNENNLASKNKEGKNLLYDVLFIGLEEDRKTLYEKTDKRVDKMLEEGLLKEVSHFYDKGIRSKALKTGIGYKELYDYLDEKINKDEAVRLIKRNTRRYVKKQYTFFKNKFDINWFDDRNRALIFIEKYLK